METNFVYITTKDKKEARTIGIELVKSRLAACVNIIDGMNSIYQWEGQLQDENEAVLIAKTKPERMSELVKMVKSLHSYSCPCIVSLPVIDGNMDFIEWIGKEVDDHL